MEGKQDIRIPLRNLKQGPHEFEYELNDLFFKQFDGVEISKGAVYIELDVERHAEYLHVDIRFEGEVEVSCDRCLENFMHRVEGGNRLEVRLIARPPKEEEDLEELNSMEEDILYMDPSEEELDLTFYCYESISLLLPIQRVHPNGIDGTSLCDPEMLKYLNQQAAPESSSSPFSVLKNLKN